MKLIAQGMMGNNNTVRSLNLSDNNMTDFSCELIADVIYRKISLTELYFHWNRISTLGAELIFNQLQDSQHIRVVDFSWNCLGRNIIYLLETLKNNTSLLHFDLSNNGFTLDDCVQISKALVYNKTIVGFHFLGNFGFVDNKGFLVVESSVKLHQSPIYKRINGIKSLHVQKNKVYSYSL